MAPACEPLPVLLGAPSSGDPHARFARLREAGPVHPARLPDGTVCWLVTRYDEARTALSHPFLSTDPAHASPPHERPPWEHGAPQAVLDRAAGRHLLHTDPPTHTRLRNLVNRALSRQGSAVGRRGVERTVDRALGRLAGHEESELLSEFALPTAFAVISELLGVPHALRARLEESAEALVVMGGRPAAPDAERAAAGEVIDLVTGLFREKRTTPEDDLLSRLASATDEEGTRFDEGELVATACLLLFTGYGTVAYALCNGVINLLTRPDQLAAARTSPALLVSAIEEVLRFEGPGDSAALRYTTASVRLGDVDIPPGECVVVSIQSANRDGCRFAAPDRFDISRKPGGHLAFGHGIHHCLGAPLARLEVEVALTRLFTRFPALRLAVDPDELEWHRFLPLRSAHRLPVRL